MKHAIKYISISHKRKTYATFAAFNNINNELEKILNPQINPFVSK